MQLTFDLPDATETEQIARQFAAVVLPPLVLGFSGEIGAGKTTFIRAMLRALGVTGAIKSPTYALVETYSVNNGFIHHFDLYRIHEEAELDYIGFRDYFTHTTVCCIEWPERLQTSLDYMDIQLSLTMKGMGRALNMQAISSRGEQVLSLFHKQGN